MSDAFSEVITWSKTEPGVYEHQVESKWLQGRGAFGGLVAGAAIRAMTDVIDSSDHRIRSLNVEFCAPVVAQSAVMTAQVVRQGNSVINAGARIQQDDETKATASATFCRHRDSKADFDQSTAPDVPPPEEVSTAPESPLFPKFASHYEYKFCVGEIPYSGADEAAVGGWCRLRDAEKPADAADAAALIDLWPPAILSTVSKPTPAATISWQVLFHHPLPLANAAADDFYLVAATSSQTVGGFAEERADLFGPDGRRIAQAQQLVAVFG